MKRKISVILLAGLLVAALVNAGIAGGGPPPKPPCGTNGPLGVTALSPSTYTYVQTSSGSTTASFTVSSPPKKVDGNCNQNLPFVYGDGKSGSDIVVEVSVDAVSNSDGTTLTLSESELAALKSAFAFSPATFPFTDPGNDNRTVSLTFTNSDLVPIGTYDVKIRIDARSDNLGEPPGCAVGSAYLIFTVEVTEPVQVDTKAPIVSISSPDIGSKLLLNAPLHVAFTAIDPPENGAGTGIIAMRASIGSCSDTWTQDISGSLSILPSLPVPAGEPGATASADINAAWIGSFSLNAEADDGADHTGYASNSFNVGVDVAPLPPLAVPGRQFKAGSTVPIKWQVSGYGGILLPPFTDIKATITTPTGSLDRVAGEGADYIRWELDASGNAIQYITNYQIPAAAVGNYTVTIYVKSVCGNYLAQGNSFSFYASTKGGK